ncbi:MAG: hypothetical protein WA603_07950 [Candidatus Acidiferrales bacterium]
MRPVLTAFATKHWTGGLTRGAIGRRVGLAVQGRPERGDKSDADDQKQNAWEVKFHVMVSPWEFRQSVETGGSSWASWRR